MASVITRDPRQTSVDASPAPVEQDQAEALPAQEPQPRRIVARAPQPGPPTGTTGGIVPQQAGTWDKPVASLSDDPQERAQQSLDRDQARFSADQLRKNPFMFSGAIPDLQKVTGRHYKERVIREGEQQHQQQQIEQRRQEIERRRGVIDQTKDDNAKLEAQFRSSGQQFYTDPHGRIQPIIEAGSGRALFHTTPWEEDVNPKTGEPTLGMRDRYGQRQFKSPNVYADPNPITGKLYYQLESGDKEIGNAADLTGHSNPKIARAARLAVAKQRQAQTREALLPALKVHNEIQQKFDDSAAQLGPSPDPAKLTLFDRKTAIDEQIAAISDDQVNQHTGDFLTWNEPTPAAAQAKAKRDQLQAQSDQLAEQIEKLTGDTAKGSGILWRRAEMSKLALGNAKLKAEHEAYGDNGAQRMEYLKQQGMSDDEILNDPIVQQSIAEQNRRAATMRNTGAVLARHQAALGEAPAVPEAPVADSPIAQAHSATPPPNAPPDIKAKWENASPLERLKMSMGKLFSPSQGIATPIKEAPPAIGSEAAGVEGSMFTIPKAEGQGASAGVIDAANKFSSAMSSPENVALMVASGGAAFLARIAQGTKIALAAHAAETGVTAAFTAQMAKDTIHASKEAYKVVQDPKSTEKQKADAITSAILSGTMTALTAKGTVESGKKTVAENASRKRAAAAEAKVGAQPSAAAEAAEARRTRARPAEPVEEAPQPAPSTAEQAAQVFEPALAERQHTPPPNKSAAESAEVFNAGDRAAEAEAGSLSQKEETIQRLVDQLSGGNDVLREGLLRRRKDLSADQFIDALQGVAFKQGLTRDNVAAGVRDEVRAAEQARTPPGPLAAERAQNAEVAADTRERAAAIDTQMTRDDRLRQSPAGGEALREDLKRGEPPEEAPSGVTADVPPEPPNTAPGAAKPEMTAREKYDDLQRQMKELGPEKFGTKEYQDLWSQSEEIKNQNKGMPPGEVSGEPVSNEPAKPAKVDAQAAATEREPAVVSGDKPAAKSANPATAPAPVSEDVTSHTPETVAGDKINKNWTAFDKDSGTLGVPREEMPQIKSEARGALVQFLKARGIEAKAGMISPSKLKPTQAEFSPGKVQAAREHTGSERPLLISSDNHVLDGHHQWMAALDDKSTPMPVIRLNAPIDRLLAETKEFPSTETAQGAKPSAKKSESAPVAAPRLSDRAIEALKKARISKPGELYGHATPFTIAWDGAIETAILAIRAGRVVHDASKLAIERFKARFPDATPEDLAALDQAIKDAHTEPTKDATPPDVSNAGIRAQVANFIKKGEIEKAMTFTRDAVDNKASVYGREQANSIKNELNRSFEGNQQAASDALAFVVESGADVAKLDAMRAKLEASTKADPKWKQRALAAIDFAKTNLDELKPVADKYAGITADQVAQENAAGIDTLKRENYVMHKQDIDESLGHPFLGTAGEGNSSFRKNREHETFADSIAAGVDPKSLNAVDLLQSRLTSGQQMTNKKAWVDSLRQFQDPITKQPIATDVTYTKRPDGSQYADAPKGYSVERVGNSEVAVMKGYEGVFSALTDGSWWNKSPIRRGIQQANGAGKSINLFFDTFHLGRLAAWNAAIRLNALGTLGGGVKAPNPMSYKEGLLVLDQTPTEIARIAKEEGRPEAQIKELLDNKQKLNMALETGANFGKISDALHQDVIHNLPLTGDFSKWLFDKYQRGAMSEIWLMEYKRQREMGGNKGLTDEQVARNVSQEVNTRFGNLGRQGIFKSKTAQDIARLLVLAPQWNEGLIRSEVGGASGAVKSAVNAAQGKGMATSMLTRSLATMVIGQFVANQLLNQYTRGKYTWENPEEGVGAKLSAWIPDKIGGGPGFFLHPAGIGAEITHLLTSRYEKTGNFRDSLASLARSRLSAIARPLATYILKTDALGRTLRPDEVNTQTAKDAVPLPIPTASVTGALKSGLAGDRAEEFPGQFQKQLMSTVGFKTDQAPSPGQRISSLASEFNKSKGIEPSGEFYAGDYTDLTTALRVANKGNAEKVIKDLLLKHTAVEIAKHYARQVNSPFTGNSKREPEFFRSLTPDQRKVYLTARKEREKLRASANAALRAYLIKIRSPDAAAAYAAMAEAPSNR